MRNTFKPKYFKQFFLLIQVTFLLLFLFHLTAFAEKQKPSDTVYIIPVEGEVGPGMSTFIKRAVEDVPKKAETLIVFEIDTFGGRVDSALQIVDTILNIKAAKTMAFVKTKAISAGALIALSCNQLYMKENTTIGDCAPISYSKEGPTMLGEKFQSPLRARFRALAKKNNYDQNLSEAMVSADLEIFRLETDKGTQYLDSTEYSDLSDAEKKAVKTKKTVVKKGELLTMNDSEAVELGFSQKSVVSIEDAIKNAGFEKTNPVRKDRNWTESLLGFIISITPVLMMIGLAAVYTEIKAPGFGAPGAVGIICLSLAFGSQYAVGLATYTELLIIILGLVLIGLEVFVIPGFGIAGISGFLFIIIGMVLSLQDFTIPKPSFPWQYDLMVNNIIIIAGSLLLSFFGTITMLRYVIPKVSTKSRGPYLTATLGGAHADSSETQRAKIGDTGIAASYLRPSGKMKNENDIFDVISEAEFIEKGTSIIIKEIRGNQIIVSTIKKRNNE